MRKEKYLKGTTIMSDPYDVDSDEDDPEVIATEWIWGKAPYILSLGEGDRKRL